MPGPGAAGCPGCCGGSARCSWTPSRFSRGRTSSSPTRGSARSAGPRWSGPTGPRRTPTTFEYWAHAACILPIADWPYYGWRRRAIAARGQRWHKVSEDACQQVLARLRDEGPLTATQLGGAKAGGPWWDWSEVKIAAEWLLDTGRAVCVRRTGWRRIYDLPERVIPAELYQQEPTDAECLAYLVGTVSRALGTATYADFVEYQRLNGYGLQVSRDGARLDEAAAAAGLVPVTVPGAPAGSEGAPGRAGRSGLGRPGRAGLAGRGRPRHAPDHAADPVRLADLGPQADAADVRPPHAVRAVRAEGQARARLLHHAAAGRRADRRLGRPGPGRQDAGGPEPAPGQAVRRRADGPRPGRGGPVDRLRQRHRASGSSPPPLAQPLAAALRSAETAS